MVSTHLKNISQIGSFPQVGMKIKNVWNHNLVQYFHFRYLELLVFFFAEQRVCPWELTIQRMAESKWVTGIITVLKGVVTPSI